MRHRIALARVLAKDAPILLLDDPAAGLDANTRAEIFRSLEGVMPGRTVISVSHAPDTLHRSAAMVGVLHNGTLAEWGAPAALSARRGLYYSLLQGGPVLEGVGGGLAKAAASDASMGMGGGAQNLTSGASKHRISQLMDSFDDELARCEPQEGAALEALRILVAEMRATAQ